MNQIKCVETCATGEYLPVNKSVQHILETEPYTTTWVACQYSALGISENSNSSNTISTFNSIPTFLCEEACTEPEICTFHSKCSYEGNPPKVNCPVIISEEKADEDISIRNPFTVNLGTSKTEYVITLKCAYATNATYNWRRTDQGPVDSINAGNERVFITDEAILRYTMDKRKKNHWNYFFAQGFHFLCEASTTSPLISNNNAQLHVKGMQSLSYGDEQTFECEQWDNGTINGTNNRTNLIWKVDGVVKKERGRGKESLIFKYDHPKRVFVECEDEGERIWAVSPYLFAPSRICSKS